MSGYVDEALAAVDLALRAALDNADDTEMAHSQADDALCEFIVALGYPGVVEMWRLVPKWYA